MARFLIDAQLPPGLASHLRSRGHDADHVQRLGLGAAADRDIWSLVERTSAILATKDIDFTALARQPSSRAAVIWIRLGNVTNDALWRALDPKLDDILHAIDAGERVIEIR